MTTHLVWLRDDRSMHDNSALYVACQDPHARVLADKFRQHLCHLADDLAARGIELHYQQCVDFAVQVEWLAAFCQREQVDRLFYNYCFITINMNSTSGSVTGNQQMYKGLYAVS